MKKLLLAIFISFFSVRCFSAEPIRVPSNSGKIIVCVPPWQSWSFPSEQLDGFFYYYFAVLMSFENEIHFYDFRTGTDTSIIEGFSEDGEGELINRLTYKALVGDSNGFTRGVRGEIQKMSLLDDGTFLFETEKDDWYRIKFTENRELKVIEANETLFNPKGLFVLDTENLNDKDDLKEDYFKYSGRVDSNGVKVKLGNRKISIIIGEKKYLIEGYKFTGIQLSQDNKKLAVFGKVSVLDIKPIEKKGEPIFEFRTDQEKKALIEEEESEYKSENLDQDGIKLRKEMLYEEAWNISVVYDLSAYPFQDGNQKIEQIKSQ